MTNIFLRIHEKIGGRCEDCDLRNALGEMGTSRVNKWTGAPLTAMCETCGGTGVQSRTRLVIRDEAKRVLTDKQLFVLERRLGLTDGRKYTHREIALAMGVDHSVVVRHEKAARKRLGTTPKDNTTL